MAEKWYNISTTQPSRNMDHRLLVLLPICQQRSISGYKLTVPLSMKGFHTLFHGSELHKQELDVIKGRPHLEHWHVEVNREEE